uniref:Uncharacterized protein n=1 Tax=Mastacembelus armatus TaxID=205130 RepID=A0A7N8YCK9_9TELE
MDDLVLFLFSSPTTVLGSIAALLVLYVVFRSFTSEETGNEPPGPRPLPVIGNLLQLDLKRPYKTLCELSKKYGSVFTVYFGPNKVVVLSGYKAVKEALINHAEEFGDRQIAPIFYDTHQEHGILFANGESWKEMRRFAITTLRDFGMGKRIAEDKILEECIHLIQMFEKHEGIELIQHMKTTKLLYYCSHFFHKGCYDQDTQLSNRKMFCSTHHILYSCLFM